MDETAFHAQADRWLAGFSGAVEAADGSGSLEVDLVEGVLTIGLSGGRTFVINKHAPSGQIWVASPLSGALRFTYDDATGAWQNGWGEELTAKLAAELEHIAGINVQM